MASNGSTIYVYLDNQLYGTFDVTDHASGTTSFAYTLSTDSNLAIGDHTIYLIAADANGKLSRRSRTITFNKSSATSIIPSETMIYTVQSGDSLWSIAQSYYGVGKYYQRLINNNKINYPSLIDNPGIIRPGWRLRL